MDISLSDFSYNRLAALAKGFETPEQVINRLIDAFESDQNKRPELIFNPVNEEEFKQALLDSKQVKVEMFKGDGSCEVSTWNARSISADSSLRANIWSGYLRGWKEKGIVRAVFTVQDEPEPTGSVIESAKWQDYKISRLESGSIVVEREGRPVTIVKPFLRKVAEELKVDLNNANGNQMNTRQLGGKIIKKLKG